MGTVLNALVKLQSVENQLRAAKAKLARCRRNVILKENQLRTLQNSREAKKEEIQLTQIQADRLELELRSTDETLAKYRAALNAADRQQCNEIEQQIEQEKKELGEIRKESEELAKKYEDEIAQIEQEWESAASEVPGETLKIFQRVAETYDGEAIVEIEVHDDRSGVYTCGGCFMSLTAETANTLLSRDEIIRCPNCTRILYFKEAESR